MTGPEGGEEMTVRKYQPMLYDSEDDGPEDPMVSQPIRPFIVPVIIVGRHSGRPWYIQGSNRLRVYPVPSQPNGSCHLRTPGEGDGQTHLLQAGQWLIARRGPSNPRHRAGTAGDGGALGSHSVHRGGNDD